MGSPQGSAGVCGTFRGQWPYHHCDPGFLQTREEASKSWNFIDEIPAIPCLAKQQKAARASSSCPQGVFNDEVHIVN